MEGALGRSQGLPPSIREKGERGKEKTNLEKSGGRKLGVRVRSTTPARDNLFRSNYLLFQEFSEGMRHLKGALSNNRAKDK